MKIWKKRKNQKNRGTYKPKGKQTIKTNATVPNNVTLLQFMDSQTTSLFRYLV